MPKRKKTQVIAVANQKGGSGKTTTAINLGAYLSALGKSVLLVDLDPQANATRALGFEPESLNKSLANVLLGPDFLEDVVKNTTIFGYEIAPACFELQQIQSKLAKTRKKEFKLQKVLKTIKQDYDFVLIDCPPTLGLLAINGLSAAQKIIIPIQCEYFALEGVGQLLKTLRELKQKLGCNLKISGALLTMYDRRNRLSRQVLKEVRLHFPGNVFEAIIPRCIKLAEAPGHGKSILQYNPSSPGARAYRQLAKEITSI